MRASVGLLVRDNFFLGTRHMLSCLSIGCRPLAVAARGAGTVRRRLVEDERGGPALLFLIAFLAMAVPIGTASLRTSGQLAQNSRVYDTKLSGDYDAASGIEVAIHEALGDPTFDDGMIPSSPDKNVTADVNGQTTTAVASKVFPTVALTGQGLSVSKTVIPTTAPVGTSTLFSYTVTFKNEGTETIALESILDFMPPGFTYAGNTWGLTSADPVADNSGTLVSCGGTPYRLEWILGVPVSLEVGEEAVLSFDATATLPNGTFLNQVRATYEPWWDNSLVDRGSKPLHRRCCGRRRLSDLRVRRCVR